MSFAPEYRHVEAVSEENVVGKAGLAVIMGELCDRAFGDLQVGDIFYLEKEVVLSVQRERFKEVSERLKVSEGTVRSWIRVGFLKARKYGKQFRITEEDFQRLLDIGLHVFPTEETQNSQEVQ